MELYVLFESAYGYSLFHAYGLDVIGQDEIKASILDLERFGKVVKLAAFLPFSTSIDALNQCNAISEGLMTDELRTFLEINLPNGKNKVKFSLGLAEPKLASQISETTKIPCQSNEFVLCLLRGVRLHFVQLIKHLKPSQLVLGHSFSSANGKFNANRVDNMLIQPIFILDTLEDDISSFSMRVREWYSWHFPELVKIVNDNYLYLKTAKFVEDKSSLNEDSIPGLVDILGDEDKAKEIVEAAKASMGQEDLSPIDLINAQQCTKIVLDHVNYRNELCKHIVTKMSDIAPNLASLFGEVVNLAKCPASTLQMHGAEKALFSTKKHKKKTAKKKKNRVVQDGNTLMHVDLKKEKEEERWKLRRVSGPSSQC